MWVLQGSICIASDDLELCHHSLRTGRTALAFHYRCHSQKQSKNKDDLHLCSWHHRVHQFLFRDLHMDHLLLRLFTEHYEYFSFQFVPHATNAFEIRDCLKAKGGNHWGGNVWICHTVSAKSGVWKLVFIDVIMGSDACQDIVGVPAETFQRKTPCSENTLSQKGSFGLWVVF